MDYVHLILNVAILLLWLNWRSIGFIALRPGARISLAGTLRRAEPSRTRRWTSLAGVAGLLLLRAVAYRQIGMSIEWTPQLNLEVLTLPFRCDLPSRTLLFSLFSFGRLLILFYTCLLFFSILNKSSKDNNPLHNLIKLHLGFLERTPWFIKLLLPILTVTFLWLATSPLLVYLEIVPRPVSTAHTLEQGFILSLAVFAGLKYPLVILLLLCVINSYIFLGESAFWGFVNSSGRGLLKPLRWLPLRVGRVDFLPIAVIPLIYYAAEKTSLGLYHVYQRLPW